MSTSSWDSNNSDSDDSSQEVIEIEEQLEQRQENREIALIEGTLVNTDQMDIERVVLPQHRFDHFQRLSILRILRWLEDNVLTRTTPRRELDRLRRKLQRIVFNRRTERMLRHTYLYWFHYLHRLPVDASEEREESEVEQRPPQPVSETAPRESPFNDQEPVSTVYLGVSEDRQRPSNDDRPLSQRIPANVQRVIERIATNLVDSLDGSLGPQRFNIVLSVDDDGNSIAAIPISNGTTSEHISVNLNSFATS